MQCKTIQVMFKKQCKKLHFELLLLLLEMHRTSKETEIPTIFVKIMQ